MFIYNKAVKIYQNVLLNNHKKRLFVFICIALIKLNILHKSFENKSNKRNVVKNTDKDLTTRIFY